MIIIGLTGSISMGKSTVADMFANLGVPVFDSDSEVHRLYGIGGAAVSAISARFPQSVVQNGVDRQKLSEAVLGNRAALKDLEKIVHPLVRQAQKNFLSKVKKKGVRRAIFEIQLLFETGADKDMDVVIVVSAGREFQRIRALARPGMTEEKFEDLLARQISDDEKQIRADYVIDTALPLDETRQIVFNTLSAIDAQFTGSGG
jgi:dephospho-CoA kinase